MKSIFSWILRFFLKYAFNFEYHEKKCHFCEFYIISNEPDFKLKYENLVELIKNAIFFWFYGNFKQLHSLNEPQLKKKFKTLIAVGSTKFNM